MSLIKCPQCNNFVSDSTLQCPKCGYSIKDNPNSIPKTNFQRYNPEKQSGNGCGIAILIVVIFGFLAF